MIDHSQLHTCQSATQQTSQETTFDHDRRPVSRWWRRKKLLSVPVLCYTRLHWSLFCSSLCAVSKHLRDMKYTTDCCIHTSDIACRQHLRSAGCHQLFVPRHRRSMFGRRAFCVAGPAARNPLYLITCEIRHVPLTVFSPGPKKTFLLSFYYHTRRIIFISLFHQSMVAVA